MKTDLVFIIDITGSMQPYWDAVVKQVDCIIKDIEVRYENTKSKLRIGFVGYRDLCDVASRRFMIRPLEGVEGSISSSTREWLESVRCCGGGDIAEVMSEARSCPSHMRLCLFCYRTEADRAFVPTCVVFARAQDVHGALEKAGSAEMLWEPDPLMTRTVVHLADAPGHGVRLHQGLESAKSKNFDQLPDHDKDGKELEHLLRHLRETVKLFCTVPMVEQFKQFSALCGDTSWIMESEWEDEERLVPDVVEAVMNSFNSLNQKPDWSTTKENSFDPADPLRKTSEFVREKLQLLKASTKAHEECALLLAAKGLQVPDKLGAAIDLCKKHNLLTTDRAALLHSYRDLGNDGRHDWSKIEASFNAPNAEVQPGAGGQQVEDPPANPAANGNRRNHSPWRPRNNRNKQRKPK
ncbi:hypothetical protein TSOC_009476 [Tetrabaena socialis]|uniref:VWFA domain-containing protein n=1 Tax=Tetrabaena socialis TaxID=47790 RepID=A0A2J7ZVT4_9CHLO|nr:hypothetical protein TSOC_009476 [Tetrabaena socialis]|eukprot:PNH04365.1 hypothetical protein TSOC_009476 [Tetrabaena socialis]